jgi:hypothetical protein
MVEKDHFYDLAIVNAHVLCNKISLKNIQIQKFCEKVAEEMACDVGHEITEQPRSTSVGRHVGKNHYAYKVTYAF